MGNCQKDQRQVEAPFIRNGPMQQLKITNFVWQNAYQGLFDYETNKIVQKQISVESGILLRKNKGQFKLSPVQEGVSNKDLLKESIFKIAKKTNYFKIFPIYLEAQNYTLQKLLWLIVRTLPEQKYTLFQKDIIKFGKQKIKIKELVTLTSNQSAFIDFDNINVSKQVYDNLDYIEEEEGNVSLTEEVKGGTLQKEMSVNQIQSVVTSNELTCRICLEVGEKTNPLIAPCRCTGSVKYVHLKCLRTWLAKRLNISKQKNCATLNWQKLNCEMCNQYFRYRVYLDNKKYYTVQVPKPEKPYVVIELLKKSNDKSTGKIYHFVSLAQKQNLSIGRKKDVDVKLSDDISISRHHATLSYDFDRHQFTVEDNRSKFGTLVLIKKSLLVRPFMQGIGFQVGTEVYRFDAFRASGQNKCPQFNDQPSYLNVEEESDDECWEDNDEEKEESSNHEDQYEEQIQRTNVELSSPDLMRRITGAN